MTELRVNTAGRVYLWEKGLPDAPPELACLVPIDLEGPHRVMVEDGRVVEIEPLLDLSRHPIGCWWCLGCDRVFHGPKFRCPECLGTDLVAGDDGVRDVVIWIDNGVEKE